MPMTYLEYPESSYPRFLPEVMSHKSSGSIFVQYSSLQQWYIMLPPVIYKVMSISLLLSIYYETIHYTLFVMFMAYI